MAEASRRAARGIRRGGLANAQFVVASAESLPLEISGVATSLTVHFPWGSLLNGLISADPAMLAGLVRMALPGATLTLLLSVTERDQVDGMKRFDGDAVERMHRRY